MDLAWANRLSGMPTVLLSALGCLLSSFPSIKFQSCFAGVIKQRWCRSSLCSSDPELPQASGTKPWRAVSSVPGVVCVSFQRPQGMVHSGSRAQRRPEPGVYGRVSLGPAPGRECCYGRKVVNCLKEQVLYEEMVPVCWTGLCMQDRRLIFVSLK